MKRLATPVLLLCLILSVAGCFAPHPVAPAPSPAPIPNPVSPPAPSSTSLTPAVPTSSPTTNPPTSSNPAPTLGELDVHFIDVGQGDSILLNLGETEVLIDAGEKSPGVVNYLKKYVDGPLEVMVATHPHADHIGGLPAVLGSFQVQQVWYNGEKSDTKTYADFTTAVQAEGTEIHIGKRGDKITTGLLSFSVLNPFNLAGTTNNNSIVLNLLYGVVDFLFTGDAEKESEAAMLLAADMPVPHADVLKVGHHGSRTASSKDFLALVSPKVAVYSAGTGNTYGHPHQETLAALAQAGTMVYGTDINGTVTISTNGETYAVTSKK